MIIFYPTTSSSSSSPARLGAVKASLHFLLSLLPLTLSTITWPSMPIPPVEAAAKLSSSTGSPHSFSRRSWALAPAWVAAASSSSRASTFFGPASKRPRLRTFRPAAADDDRHHSLSSDDPHHHHHHQELLQPKDSDQRVVEKKLHLVLVGGGHAHVQVIKALHAQARPPNVHVTLIDPCPQASYSGMVPGCLAGYYTPQQTQLNVAALAARSEMTFVPRPVIDIDLDKRQVLVQDHPHPVPFDVISIDIGSTTRNIDSVPGVREYAIPTRPIQHLIQRLNRAREQDRQLQQSSANPSSSSSSTTTSILASHSEPIHLVVVGGGAAGIELAMTVSQRWKRTWSDSSSSTTSSPPPVTCTLLDAGQELLPDESPLARHKLTQILQQLGVSVRHGAHVQQVTKECVVLRDGASIPYTHCIWATGAGPHALARHLHQARGLDTTTDGWITVSPTLQSTSHPFVFSAGDCASIQGLAHGPPPKAGVYAVRAGPILLHNLLAYLHQLSSSETETSSSSASSSLQEKAPASAELLEYQPQDDFLKLLVCGDGTALGFRFGLALHGPWVFRLKDYIDRSFMQLFNVDQLPPLTKEGTDSAYDTRQYDAEEAVDWVRLTPAQAAALLQRTDDQVDVHMARRVLRAMAEDLAYRQAVVACVEEAAGCSARVAA